MTWGLVRIHLDGDGARVYAPWSASWLIKRFGRRNREWLPEQECWWVSLGIVDRLSESMMKAGYSVRVLRQGEDPPPVELPRFGPIRGANWPWKRRR